MSIIVMPFFIISFFHICFQSVLSTFYCFFCTFSIGKSKFFILYCQRCIIAIFCILHTYFSNAFCSGSTLCKNSDHSSIGACTPHNKMCIIVQDSYILLLINHSSYTITCNNFKSKIPCHVGYQSKFSFHLCKKPDSQPVSTENSHKIIFCTGFPVQS